MNLGDYDYFLTNDNIFFIVKGYYHTSNHIRCLPIYAPSPTGTRFCNELNLKFEKVLDEYDYSFLKKIHPGYLKKEFGDTIIKVPYKDIKKIYRPREKFQSSYKKLKPTFWGIFYQKLHDICGVSFKDIGIYGSYLIDLLDISSENSSHDLDTVIFGSENIKKLKTGFPKVLAELNRVGIDKSIIRRVLRRYKRQDLTSYSTFSKIIARYWPTIKISNKVSMTLRMAYKSHEVPRNPIVYPSIGATEIEGIVLNDQNIAFCPLQFTVKDACGNNFTVVSYLFVYQYAVKKGDLIKVKGNLRADGKTITLDKKTHGIKILN